MNTTALLVSMASMGGLGAIFSLGLIIASIKLHVEEDPRIKLVIDELPGANCGGCGYPGCNAFAEKIVLGTADLSACPVNTAEAVQEIAKVMGITVEVGEKKVARVLCRGGEYETAKKGSYLGIKTCLAAHLTFGGEKLCQYGCLGFGDCILSCPFDAIVVNENGLPVIDEVKCTGCGNCRTACPRDLIEIHPISHNLFVFCKSRDEAKFARQVCLKACTGCKACAKGAGEGCIEIRNNLAVINYELYGTVTQLPTEKCPNSCITMVGSPAAETTRAV
jgi:Na+-translocating ferredoxin:NAD+ oxidoreductase subunit B